MNFDALVNTSAEDRAAFIDWLTQQTVSDLKSAGLNVQALEAAIHQFYTAAKNAQLNEEEIEDILGVNEPCIMDLAGLCDEAEEIIIAAFEQLTNQPASE